MILNKLHIYCKMWKICYTLLIKKKDRPIITYDIQEGSVRHIFKTSIQAVIGFSALLSQIQSQNNIDFLELKTARAIEEIQKISRQKNYEFQIKTSLEKDAELKINPSTKFFRTENIWVDAEFYFYGILKDAGGKSKANIKIDTSDYGYLSIETGEEFLKEREDNLLYKNYGVRATGKQNIDTGEVDTKSLELVELIDYNPKFDNDYLKTLINKAKNNWKGINADEWLLNMRGGYEA
ncbi:hypothetical protein P700755_003015 [Psychroflexus torquis ATCC 700755]|uniref:Uncharacterized protein n=1 Tax=Psychroflexus torquis (strain ATCC 700755 / CIP 106069 / ACAM 623) TaxID=313595 RepID=K4IIP7_PSYTT|nr:hypothetical protein [Psychroflexus torquis]AFU69693.1 hypothetical protein P700755_003015 [Psychroflexus torquis ATCC 700755]